MPNDTVLVIGGGPAGLEAARGVGDLGGRAILVEMRDKLGGAPIHEHYAALTPDFRDAATAMGEIIAAAAGHPNVEVHLNSQVIGFAGTAGDFTVTLDTAAGTREVHVGAVILATGFKHFDPGRETQYYGYYEFPDVLTLTDLEKMLKAHRVVRPSNGQPPKSLCFIQCVGSRDRQIGNQWCSKVCCGIACKQAIEVRTLVPDCKVYIFYIDLRAYGFWEDDLYWKAQEQHKVNYIRGIVTEVLKKGDRLLIRGEDTTFNRPMEVLMDMVVLSVGMEPSEGTRRMAGLLGLPLEHHGWVATRGGPLDTVSTPAEGIFACGAATGPADLEDSISSGGAAAMKAVSFLRRRSLSRR